jgi:ketosteroid isomerase-like protein
MGHDNVEIVRGSIEHFMATGEPQWSVVDDDIEVYDHDIPDAGEYRGHAGYRRWLEDWAGAWSEFALVPEDFIGAGERVLVVLRLKARGRSSGVAVEREDAMLVLLRAGMAVRLDYFNNKQQAFEQAGIVA